MYKIKLMPTAEVKENPSPSNDEWFDDPEDLRSVHDGIGQMKRDEGRVYTMNEVDYASHDTVLDWSGLTVIVTFRVSSGRSSSMFSGHSIIQRQPLSR